MKSLVHTEELCSLSVPLEHAPGEKFLMCIDLKDDLPNIIFKITAEDFKKFTSG